MTLANFKEECLDALCEAVKQMLCDDDSFTCATVSTNNGYLDIGYHADAKDHIEVIVYHDNEDANHPDYNEHERICPRLAECIKQYLTENLSISELEEELEEEAYYDDIWHRNGFESEADYIRYRYA
ncbi:MAG: hypothetical protein KBT34_05630 [Prevotella sp.]|nr:hypothetical protein [Candidatus Prevotella equi]